MSLILITKHAYMRAKERLSLNAKSFQKQTENPDKKLRPPIDFTGIGELSISELKMKYRGVRPCDY